LQNINDGCLQFRLSLPQTNVINALVDLFPQKVKQRWSSVCYACFTNCPFFLFSWRKPNQKSNREENCIARMIFKVELHIKHSKWERWCLDCECWWTLIVWLSWLEMEKESDW